MMIDDGIYQARATTAVFGRTSTGIDQVAVNFTITRCPRNQHVGAQIVWFGYFTDKTIDRTLESLRICGWTGDDLSNLQGLTENEVSLDIGQEENPKTGERSSRVKWVNALGGIPMREPMTAETLKAFAASMRGAIAAYNKKHGGTASSSPNARPASKGSPHDPPSSARPQQQSTPNTPTESAASTIPVNDDIPF